MSMLESGEARRLGSRTRPPFHVTACDARLSAKGHDGSSDDQGPSDPRDQGDGNLVRRNYRRSAIGGQVILPARPRPTPAPDSAQRRPRLRGRRWRSCAHRADRFVRRGEILRYGRHGESLQWPLRSYGACDGRHHTLKNLTPVIPQSMSESIEGCFKRTIVCRFRDASRHDGGPPRLTPLPRTPVAGRYQSDDASG
jgi:hypothetical protein